MTFLATFFYQDLYAKDTLGGGSPEHWLGGSNLPKLTDEELETLGAPVTQEELEQAISDLKAQKAPGPDGYTGKFFKILKKEISPSLTALFNSFLTGTPIPSHMNMAYIKV